MFITFSDVELLAHLKHGINRVVIFDIDLHHGVSTLSSRLPVLSYFLTLIILFYYYS
jgi:hypothetical protein